MSDATLRSLERSAETGGPEEQARLEAARARLIVPDDGAITLARLLDPSRSFWQVHYQGPEHDASRYLVGGWPYPYRVNSKLKTWKTRPGEFSFRVKHGGFNRDQESRTITHLNADQWTALSPPPLVHAMSRDHRNRVRGNLNHKFVCRATPNHGVGAGEHPSRTEWNVVTCKKCLETISPPPFYTFGKFGGS